MNQMLENTNIKEKAKDYNWEQIATDIDADITNRIIKKTVKEALR